MRKAGGCGEFYGALSALFEVRQGPFGGELALLYTDQEGHDFAPEAAVDSRDDGRIDLLFPYARLRGSGADYVLEAISVPDLDCPC